jgi:hypothetical protein
MRSRQKHLIDVYGTSIQVMPDTGTKEVQLGTTPLRTRTVHYGNRAIISYTASFTRGHRLNERFSLRYMTQNDGFIGRPRLEGSEDCSTPVEKARHEDHGTEVYFSFLPRASGTYGMTFEVFKGFDKWHRNMHRHIPANVDIRRCEILLDLSAYITLGYELAAPKLYFDVTDRAHCDLCTLRTPALTVEPYSTERFGTWKWSIANVTSGIFDVFWDIVGNGNAAPAPREVQATAGRAEDMWERVVWCIRSNTRFHPELILFTRIGNLINQGLTSFAEIGDALGYHTSGITNNIDSISKHLEVGELTHRKRRNRVCRLSLLGQEVMSCAHKYCDMMARGHVIKLSK